MGDPRLPEEVRVDPLGDARALGGHHEPPADLVVVHRRLPGRDEDPAVRLGLERVDVLPRGQHLARPGAAGVADPVLLRVVDVDPDAVLVEDDVTPPEPGDLADAAARLVEDGDDRSVPRRSAGREDPLDLVGRQQGVGRGRRMVDVRDLDRLDLLPLYRRVAVLDEPEHEGFEGLDVVVPGVLLVGRTAGALPCLHRVQAGVEVACGHLSE
ncbi:hypothetical protein DSECCO2_433850 [anaerobic digester metagenome]